MDQPDTPKTEPTIPEEQPQVVEPQPTPPVAPTNQFFNTPTFTTEQEVTMSSASTVMPGTPGSTAPKPKRKWLPWVVTGVVALLIGGSASAYYFLVYQNPNQVLYDAYMHLQAAKVVQAKGLVTIDKDIGGVKLKTVTYATNYDNGPNMSLDVTANMEVSGAAVAVGGKGMFTQDGTLYFQVTGLYDAIDVALKNQASTQQLTAAQKDAVKKIQDQWVRITMDDIKKSSPDTATAYQCVLDAYKKHKDDDPKIAQDMYKANPFIAVKGSMGTKNGNYGLRLNFDADKYKAYLKAAKDTAVYKDINACNKNAASSTDDSQDYTALSGENTTNTAVIVWVSQWAHELKQIEYNGSVGTGSDKVAYSGTLDFAYDKTVKITAPSDTINLEEFMNRVQVLTGPLGDSVQQRAESTSAQTTAMTVAKKAEAFYAISGAYPNTLADFEKYPETSLASVKNGSVLVTESFPTGTTSVGFKMCSATYGQVVYYDTASKQMVSLGIGRIKGGNVTTFCSGLSV